MTLSSFLTHMGFAGSQYHQGPGPLYINDPLKPFLPPTVYYNTEQSYTNVCPDGTTGDPITVTVPAGTFSSTISQEFVDAEALASAIEQANALRAESPCITQIPNVLWGWGSNFRGALGVGNTSVQITPVITGYSALEWVKVRLGSDFGLGIKTDGTLWSWGANFEGQLGLGTQSIFPSTANNKIYPTQVGSNTDWVDIACGEEDAAAIKSDGTLWTWGYNGFGQLGQGDTASKLSPTQVGSETNWASVAASCDTLIAIKTDGTLWASGANSKGQFGDGSTASSTSFVQCGTDTDWAIVAISATSSGSDITSVGIKTDGTLWMWGSNAAGQFGNGTSDNAPHATPLQIGIETWIAVAEGDLFTVAIKSDRTLWSAGLNNAGQLGQGDMTSRTTFAQIGNDATWKTVSCDVNHATAQKTNGEMWGWGTNDFGQLGQGGESAFETSPVQMGSDDNWSFVVAGATSVMALRTVLTDPAPPPGNNGIASGGSYTEVAGKSIHRFDANGTFTVYADTVMDYVVIGGGGGGGGIGGGGAGQFQKLTGITVPAGTYTVAVAQRAFRAFGGEDRGGDGGSATFNGTTSVGGGGGGAIDDSLAPGADGASGGGGGYLFTPPSTGQSGGIGTAGNAGGDGFTNSSANGAGGGGGGNAGAGINGASNTGGNGGAGISDSITGTAIFYCAGGGGGGPTTGGSGGSSVGGNGSSGTAPATPGLTAGSGGGGGLGNFWPAGSEQGDGAYGTVIISYPTPP